MRIRSHISLYIIGILLALSLPTSARQGWHDHIVWGKKQSTYTGLYTTNNYFISHGVSLNVSALYYFGDVDNEGLAFHGGFNMNNLSIGGGITLNYTLPVASHTNMRFSLMGGTMHGDNELKFKSLPEPRDDYRKFHSIIVQPAVGVEVYPIHNAGLFLYAGVAFTASIIDNYEFYYYKKVGSEKVRTLLQGSTFGFLPMIQLGLGYSWALSPSWMLSVELMVQEGLIDTHYMNLDAFPLAPAQNTDGVALGNSFGKWVDKYGNEHLHWNDGWFQLGITISYRWRNCESCRMFNTYQNPVAL